MELDGAVVIVTGAARGLGRAIAEGFASRGAKVALVDILEDEVRTAAAAMEDAGWSVLPVVTDTTDAGQVAAMAKQVTAEMGPADVLVNNAGTFSVIGPVWEAEAEQWLRDVRTNLYGSFLCCREVVKGMVARQAGYVINIVSSGGVGDPHPYSTSYACSKTGLMRLTEGLAKEAEPYGVKVFAVGPPAIRTAMTEFIMDDPGGRKWRPNFSEIFEQGRDTPPEAVAGFIVKLVSGKADRLTGRYFNPKLDFDEIVADAERIVAGDLWTLRIRR